MYHPRPSRPVAVIRVETESRAGELKPACGTATLRTKGPSPFCHPDRSSPLFPPRCHSARAAQWRDLSLIPARAVLDGITATSGIS